MKSASTARSANFSTITIGGALLLSFAFNQFTAPIIQISNPKRHYSISQHFFNYMFASESERRNEIYNYVFNSSTAINSDRKVGKYKLYHNSRMSIQVELRVLSSQRNFS